MSKLVTLEEITQISRRLKKKDLKVGMICGVFDVMHLGLIRILEFAKSRSDYVIVALDNDETVRLSRGEDRPIFNFRQRAELLSAIEYADYIFKIEFVAKFATEKYQAYSYELYNQIKPTYLVSDSTADPYFAPKKILEPVVGYKLLDFAKEQPDRSPKILVH